jgi:hypothetical protein
VDPDRNLVVEKPSTTNNLHFAGVAAQGYVANASGQWIDIIEPGCVAEVYAYKSCTIGVTQITAAAGQYYFYTQGFLGRGSALALQTIDRSSTKGLVQAYLQDGQESGLVEIVTPAAGAMTGIMVAGVTYFPATSSGLGTDATFTLADGTFIGERKMFVCEGTMSTADIVVTVTTPQIIAAVATSGYDVWTGDAAGEFMQAVWNGFAWEIQGKVVA